MGKLVRFVSIGEDGSKSYQVGFVRPEQESKKPEQNKQFSTEQSFDFKSNPSRYKLAFSDPRLRVLLAKNLPPWERKAVYKSLIERLIHELEKEN